MEDIIMSQAMQILSVISTVLSITVGGGVFMLIFRAGKMTEKLERIEKILEKQVEKCTVTHKEVDAQLKDHSIELAKHTASAGNTGPFKPQPST